MSYKLEYPYTEEEKNNFIVQYNHNQGLRIETVDNLVEEEIATVTTTEYVITNYPTYYALEANEIMGENEEGLSLPIINPNYDAELEQKERERIAKFYLTGADVERGIYQAKGMDFEDIISMVGALQTPSLEGEGAEGGWGDIDIKALKIELKANHFYRGNPYVDAVGTLLGFTSEQLDKFFETNDYTYLLEVKSCD